jgi:hypothetical protein
VQVLRLMESTGGGRRRTDGRNKLATARRR